MTAYEQIDQLLNDQVNGHAQTWDQDTVDVLTDAALSDVGNAERLLALHAGNLRFAPGLGWLVWDGVRWARDDTGEVMRRAETTLAHTKRAAASIKGNSDKSKALFAHALRSERRNNLEAMVALAQIDLRVVVRVADLDANPLLLNCRNGTVDLRTGELRRHDRLDLITKVTAAKYNSEATAPAWERFLEAVLPDEDVRAFTQRASGYSATGCTDEQVLLIGHGPGADGKSTFIEAIRRVLGDYGGTMPASALLAQRDGGSTNDLARLPGCVSLSPARRGGPSLERRRVKALTGGDTIIARFCTGSTSSSPQS